MCRNTSSTRGVYEGVFVAGDECNGVKPTKVSPLGHISVFSGPSVIKFACDFIFCHSLKFLNKRNQW